MSQPSHFVCFACDWYLPVSHSMHESKADDVEYSPAPHLAHRLAPVLVPVLVIDPAWQVVHDVTFDPLEYVPAAHAAHKIAPAATPVSVRDPAKHTLQ